VCGRETLIQSRGQCGVAAATKAGARRNAPLHTGALIATFRCAGPARCGAFADERRIVAVTKAAQCHTKRSSSPRAAKLSRRVVAAFWPTRFAGRAATSGSRFTPFDGRQAGS
jgi:hypothetical protein